MDNSSGTSGATLVCAATAIIGLSGTSRKAASSCISKVTVRQAGGIYLRIRCIVYMQAHTGEYSWALYLLRLAN